MLADARHTPVLLIVFNRLDTARRVLAQIRRAAPRQLFIAADGPRPHVLGEVELCESVRQSLLDMIDWPCTVETRFLDLNVGCGRAVSEAISWFFEHVDRGIILEDDCLPSDSFFPFCHELLERYVDDTRVMAISGSAFVEKDAQCSEDSYVFTRLAPIWGWASWRRAWRHFRLHIDEWPAARAAGVLEDLFVDDPTAWGYFIDMFDRAHAEPLAWDAQWTFYKLINGSTNIVSSRNLIKNIGFSEAATHTESDDGRFSCMQARELSFPLRHPKFFVVDAAFDHETLVYCYEPPAVSKLEKVRVRLRSAIPPSTRQFAKNLLARLVRPR